MLATIDQEMIVTIPLANTLYERYQLERFADWKGQHTTEHCQEACYQITAGSVWRSQQAGVKTEQIIRFVKRVCQDQVPTAILETLETWKEGLGRAFINKVVILRTSDERTMQQISEHPEIRPLLGEQLSSTTCLVDGANIEALARKIKGLGIWPHLMA